ncbi:MAG: hypothetical protein ACXWG9_11870 [Usitatibacter sp.]
MSGRITQCLTLLFVSAVAGAAQAQDLLNVKVQLQISADCGGHPQIVNSTATGQFRPSFTPTGVLFNDNLAFQANPTNFSCPRTFYNRQTKKTVAGEERFAIVPQGTSAVTALTIIWPSQYMQAEMSNLMVGLKIGRCSSESYANGQKIRSYNITNYGASFTGGTQDGRADANISPTLRLTQADVSKGFSGTYTIKGIGACGESSLGEKDDPNPWQGQAGHMLDATAVVTLNYKAANQAQVAIAPCADIVVGQSASVQATGTPAGGKYDWTGSGEVQVRGTGSTATLTGAKPGKGRVQVRYTAPDGRTAADDKPVTSLRVKALNGGAPIPQIGLYGVDGKLIGTPTIVALSVEPADAGDRLSFKPADAALLSVTSRGDALMLQGGPQTGKTQIIGKTSCGQSVGGPWPVEVRRCTDDVIATLKESERAMTEALRQHMAAAARALDSPEFKKAAAGLGKASGDVVIKTGTIIISTLGGASGGTTGEVSEVIAHAANIRDMAEAEDGAELATASAHEFVQTAGNPLTKFIADAADLLKTATDFGDKLGAVMGANARVESILKELEQINRQMEDIVRRERICKEPQATSPQEPEPPKPEPGRKPAPPKPPGQTPQRPAPPGTTPQEPPSEPPSQPPSVPPPPYQPTGTRTLALPFDQSCTCGAGRAVTASADGLATLQTGLGQMKSCTTGYANQVRDFEGTLKDFKALLGEISQVGQLPASQRAAKAKQWSARLGSVVDHSRKFEAAGKAVLQNGKACPAAMDASLGIMTNAATSPSKPR